VGAVNGCGDGRFSFAIQIAGAPTRTAPEPMND